MRVVLDWQKQPTTIDGNDLSRLQEYAVVYRHDQFDAAAIAWALMKHDLRVALVDLNQGSICVKNYGGCRVA